MHRLIQGLDEKKGEPDEHLSYFLYPFMKLYIVTFH